MTFCIQYVFSAVGQLLYVIASSLQLNIDELTLISKILYAISSHSRYISSPALVLVCILLYVDLYMFIIVLVQLLFCLINLSNIRYK